MKLFTTEEVAKILKIDPETVRRFVNEEKIIAFKVGREWRIKEGDLTNFIESNSNISKGVE